MRLKEVGEFGLIDRIASRVPGKEGVRIGIGDDAAALDPSPGLTTLVSADMLLEGIHFDLAFCDPASLGRKSLAVNLSDIAAMGGVPRHCLLSLGIPSDLSVEFVDLFTGGLLELAAESGVALVGGDTCASRSGLVIAVTIMGEQRPDRITARGGARPGDLIFVTGTLGDSALGLLQLKNGERTGESVRRHLAPSPRVREGLALAEARVPSAMIDVSDGLLADLGHILDLSGVGAIVELARLPLSPSYLRRHRQFHEDPFLLPLTGGEDYELLFTVPPERRHAVAEILGSAGAEAAVIGEITARSGLSIVTGDGTPYSIPANGYNHFC